MFVVPAYPKLNGSGSLQVLALRSAQVLRLDSPAYINEPALSHALRALGLLYCGTEQATHLGSIDLLLYWCEWHQYADWVRHALFIHGSDHGIAGVVTRCTASTLCTSTIKAEAVYCMYWDTYA